jgi:hypothetical protein
VDLVAVGKYRQEFTSQTSVSVKFLAVKINCSVYDNNGDIIIPAH